MLFYCLLALLFSDIFCISPLFSVSSGSQLGSLCLTVDIWHYLGTLLIVVIVGEGV